MGFYSYIKQNENTFSGAKNIKYFYMPPKKKSNHLIVTFSGFHGRENEGIGATYNYVKPISKIDCHRLFILDDYNGAPCYYLGGNKTNDYEVSVAALILKFASEYRIQYQNIITCGSSKGGTAAVYFAFKYNFGYACVGAFQLKVGTYLQNVSNYTRESVLGLITGEYSIESVKYLDNYFIYFFESMKDYKPYIKIHAGNKDPHYLNHVVPFLKILEKNNKKYDLDLQNYDNHGKVGTYYTEYLLEELPKIVGKNIFKKVEISTIGNVINTNVESSKYFEENADVQYAYYLYKEGQSERIDYKMYTKNNTIEFPVVSPGKYRVKVFLKTNDEKLTEYTDYVEVKF